MNKILIGIISVCVLNVAIFYYGILETRPGTTASNSLLESVSSGLQLLVLELLFVGAIVFFAMVFFLLIYPAFFNPLQYKNSQ